MPTNTGHVHHCHARGCDVPVPRRLLMCGAHWRLVPRQIQAAIWRTYRPGQERDTQPSAAYLQAAAQAVVAVAELEGRAVPWTTLGEESDAHDS